MAQDVPGNLAQARPAAGPLQRPTALRPDERLPIVGTEDQRPAQVAVSLQLEGRVIKRGQARGKALCSAAPISFFGGVDPDTGIVTEADHPLEGQCMAGRVLVFPQGKGSTVGSYALLRLARGGVGPVAIVNHSCETIVAVGAIIAGIPCVDQVPIDQIPEGAEVEIDGETLRVLDP